MKHIYVIQTVDKAYKLRHSLCNQASIKRYHIWGKGILILKLKTVFYNHNYRAQKGLILNQGQSVKYVFSIIMSIKHNQEG